MKRLAALFIATRLYLVAVPCALWLSGAALNQVVLVANGGKFPVMGLSETNPDDRIHCPMTSETKVNWLADFVNLKAWILSPGDLMMDASDKIRSAVVTAWVTLLMIDVARLKRKE